MTIGLPAQAVPGHNSGIKRQLDQRLHNHLESTCTQ